MLPDSEVSHDLSATLVVANVLYRFRDHARIQPYVFGGLGHVSADYTYRCVDCVFSLDPIAGEWVSRGVQESRSTGSRTGFTYGAGLKIAVQRFLSIRAELLLANTTQVRDTTGAGCRCKPGWACTSSPGAASEAKRL